MFTKAQQTHFARTMEYIADEISNVDRSAGELLLSAHNYARNQEIQHRALGKRWNQDVSMRLSAVHTGWLFVARAFFTMSPRDLSTLDLARLREDYRNAVFARSLCEVHTMKHERILGYTLYDKALLMWDKTPITVKGEEMHGGVFIERWDYSRDVAGNL
jgi:hypothetical protein